MSKRKDLAAVALGRKGGKASARKLTNEERREKARKAARAKWAKAQAEPGRNSPTRMGLVDKRAAKLTKREREVAEYAARGRSNAYIAQHFRIGLNTVKKHVGHALAKLGVSNRTELAVLLTDNRNALLQQAPQWNTHILGSVMLEAAKEAYQMAEYLTRQGQPRSERQQENNGSE